jgi:outer membrane receptor for ferric coprogen and ferric-rhodotorulic acid
MEHGGQDDFIGITPIFSYDIDEDTTAWLRIEIAKQDVAQKRNAWWADVDNQLPFGIVPVDRAVGNLQDPDDGINGYKTGLEMGYRTGFEILNSNWNARFLARHSATDGTFRIYLVRQKNVVDSAGNILGAIGRADGDLPRISFSEYRDMVASGQAADIQVKDFITRGRDFDRKALSVTADLTGTFNIGQTTHTVFTYASVENSNVLFNNFRWDQNFNGQSVFNQVGGPTSELLTNFRLEGTRPRETDADEFAFALQDNISFWGDKVHVSLGGRYDSAEAGTVTTANANTPNVVVDPFNTNDDWSFKKGLVVQPFKDNENSELSGLSIYFNDSETFTPNETTNEIGEILPNIGGEMEEVGFKMNFWDRRLTATLARYNIAQTNVRENDFEDIDGDGEFESILRALGTREIEGTDLDLAFQPTDALSLFLSYQDMDKAEVGASGLQARGVPVGVNYSAIGKYKFLEGSFAGLSVGVTHRSFQERAADNGDNFRVPGYSLTGLFGSYTKGSWRYQVNIDNLDDKEYVETSVNDFLVAPGPPLNVRFSATYTFGSRDR